MRQIFLTLCFFVGFTLSVLVGLSNAACSNLSSSRLYTGYSVPGSIESSDGQCRVKVDSNHGRWVRCDYSSYSYSAVYDDTGYVGYYVRRCTLPPERTNGIKDPDEDGIDCGYEGGPACEKKCPSGYIFIDGTCYRQISTGADYPDLLGKPIPEQYADAPGEVLTPDHKIYDPGDSVTPILAAPNTNVPDSSFPGATGPTTPNTPDSMPDPGPSDITTVGGGSSGNGDYVIKDGLGNVKGFRQTNETSTDNGDGTTTHYHTTTIYNPETGQNTTTTTETTTDNTTGETLSSTTSYSGKGSGSTGTAVQNGMGSSDGVTGDQYSSGVGTITGAVKDSGKGIEKAIGKLGEKLDGIGDGITAIGSGDDDGEDDLGEFVEPVYDGLSDESTAIPDDSEYSIESLLSDFFNEYMQFGFITVFMETTLDTNSTYCSVTGSVYGSTVTLSICEYEYVFNQLGAIFSLICQLSALFITFGGLD